MKEKLSQGVTLVVDRYAFSGVAFTSAKKVSAAWPQDARHVDGSCPGSRHHMLAHLKALLEFVILPAMVSNLVVIDRKNTLVWLQLLFRA